MPTDDVLPAEHGPLNTVSFNCQQCENSGAVEKPFKGTDVTTAECSQCGTKHIGYLTDGGRIDEWKAESQFD